MGRVVDNNLASHLGWGQDEVKLMELIAMYVRGNGKETDERIEEHTDERGLVG